MKYNVYVFTDKESMMEVTNTYTPNNCWVRVVDDVSPVGATRSAVYALTKAKQLLVSNEDDLYAAVIPSDNLEVGTITRLYIYARVSLDLYVEETV
jgi:hypothetical protein